MAKTASKAVKKATPPRNANKYEADFLPATIPNRLAVEVIVGYHPRMGHKHILTLYDNGQIRIKRDDLVTINPATKEEERTSFDTVFESFVNHQYLWDTIKNNPNPCQQEQ